MASKSIGLLNIVFGADLRGFERAMKKAQKSVKKFGKSMQRTGANMTRNITMPVIALGAVAIKTFADFEQAMLKVKAVSGATGSEFEALKNKAKALGSSTMFTASEVAGLQLELAKLGFTTDQINKSTESILQLSQATGHDLAQSGEIVASTLNSFSMETTEATKVADIFAVASSSAAIDMEKLSVAMPTVGATAAAVGIPLEDLTAQMMVLADRGMEASTMGTHLRKIFVELATKGISYEDAMAKINTSTNKVKTATELFGKRAFAAGLILAKSGDEVKTYRGELDNATGTAKKMSDIMDSGVGGAMRRLKSQAEGVAIQLGEMLVPVFTKLLNKIKDLLGWWSGLDKETKNIIVTIGILAAALGPVVSVIGTMAVAFAGLLSPIGLTVAAILAIVVAFAYVRENWEAFKERLGDWSWWKNALLQALAWVIEYSPISLLIKGFNKLAVFLGKEPIKNPFEAVADGLEDLMVETKEYENEFGSFKDAMINQAKELDDVLGVTTFFKGAGKKIGVGGGTGGGEDDEAPLIGDTEQAFETYQEYLDSLKTGTEGTVKSLSDIWNDFWGDWGEKIGEAIKKVKMIMSSLSGLISAVNTKEQAEFDIWRESQEEKTDILDGQMERELERVEESGMSDKDKADAKIAIEERYAEKKGAIDDMIDKKEKALKRKQAIRDKAMAIVSAIISTAEAIMGAVAASPLTGGLPWSALVAALGAAQIGTIASTPIPFEMGGLVSGPTLGLIGEGSGTSAFNPEVVSPLDKLMGMMGTSNVNVHGRIQGDNIVLVSDKAEISRERFI